MPPRPHDDDDDLVVPPELTALGEYADLRPLGKGGMGVVYVGTHTLMGRQVVLKVMTPAAQGDEAATERFLREIRAAALLDHPNVVKAYAAHQAGRRLVFVMEYVPGDDLAKVVGARGPLPVANAAYYAYHAALGLQHAHDRGMVHRDIKPGNLLLAKAFGKTVVKVADFGLAKAAREREVDAGLTGDGRLMGTPHYIAPEQALDAARADIRADVYSLGCTLYHLLAGNPPFGGTVLALIDAHRSATAEPLHLLRPEVPVELAVVVARMMAKDPADRFQTPGDAAKALVPFFKPAGGSGDAPRLEATPVETVRPAPVEKPPPASYWKPPTVFRGSVVPTDTAYLNAEDFNPAAKPPKPPRRKKEKSPPVPVLGLVAGGGVLLAALVVGGLFAAGAFGPAAGVPVVPADAPAAGQVADVVPQAVVPPTPPAAGFVPLFNGRDKGGWTVPVGPDNWAVEDGVLVARGGTKASHLFSDRSFADFHLRAEFRINAGGNSGVYFRSAPADRYPTGYEAQIYDASGKSGPPIGSLYFDSQVVAWSPAAGRSGEWTTLEVIAAGPQVTVKVNGATTCTYTAPAGRPAGGRIALQHHNPQTVIEFRRVEVKELDAPAVPPSPPSPQLVFGSRAPDLPAAQRVALLEFDTPSANVDTELLGARDGHFVIIGEKAKRYGWNLTRVRADGDFAVEAVGRVRGGPAAGWGLNLSNWIGDKTTYGVYARLTAGGEAALLPGWFAKPQLTAPLVAPVRHPAVLTGEQYNRLLVVALGDDLRVYVNGALVCGPVRGSRDLVRPVVVQLTAEGATAVELDRLSVYTLPPGSTAVAAANLPAPAAAPPKPPDPKLKGFAGIWKGQWSNSQGGSGSDALELKVDADGRCTGKWTQEVRLTGRVFSHDTIELQGTKGERQYKVTGTLKNGTLTLKYTVTTTGGQPLYVGRSELKRP